MMTSYLYLVFLAQRVGEFAFLSSSLLGILFIYLTLFGVRKIFGTYKYLMAIFTSLGVILGCLEAIFHPNLHFYNNGFVLFTLSTPFGMSKGFLETALVVYPGVYSLTIALLAVQFIYRYWALFRYDIYNTQRNRDAANFSLNYLEYFRGWKSSVWLLYCIVFGGVWFAGACYFLSMDEISENYFKSEMLLRYNVLPGDIPMMTFLAFDPTDGSVRLDVLYTVLISSIMAIQYGIMMYCGWMMHSKMEEKIKGMSSSMKHQHRQLFKALVFQITTPTIFLFSPLILIIYLPYFQLELSLPAGAAVTAFNIYPAMDTIIVFIVITEYQRAMKRMWTAFLLKLTWKNESGNSPPGPSTDQINMSVMRSATAN